ncbi:MAG: ATP-binding protein [Chloroflexota bacterium]|nr:ATP-binding protein [Chloroflexota bacterium]
MPDGYRLTVPAQLDQLITISEFIAHAAHQTNLDERTVFQVQMAVDEACTNIIQHAYQGLESGEITINCHRTNDSFVVTIQDHGRAFDPTAVPPPDLSADIEARRVGGLGLYFMRRLMDEVCFEFDEKVGNTVTMTKRIAPRPRRDH